MASDKTLFCGIDLGTTNSCIAVLGQGNEQGKAVVIEIDGQATLPSVVAYKEGQWLVGQQARNHQVIAPTEAISSIKRKMDDPGYRVELGGETLSAIDISAKIIEALVRGAEQQLGCRIAQAVITVPAWFQEQQRQATLAAGRKAGLEVLQIVNEPTAAALAHERLTLEDGEEENWLVYDLGGGTFDVSLLSVTAASYEVLASAGNSFLGGDDFDHRLLQRFISQLRDQHNIDVSADLLACARLQLLAEQTKMHLSSNTTIHLQEPILVGEKSYMLDLQISREEFEELIADLIDSTLEKASQVLTEASMKASQLNRLLLVGGSTRIPLISEKLQKRFAIDADTWLDADLSVAMGACIRAAICMGQFFDRSVVDICPHSLGIAAMGEEDMKAGGRGMGDEHDHPLSFSPLIRRNSRLPASFKRTFFKSSDRQRGAQIPVYQGEHVNRRQNNFIGEFYVEFSQQDCDQLEIEFSYDINGTIQIRVNEGGGGTERSHTMSLSRNAEENSETFFEDDSFENDSFEGNTFESNGHITSKEDDTAATNYLIEKAQQKLKQDSSNTEIANLLKRYQTVLGQEGDDDADDELDELEDHLYEWLEEQ